MQHSLFGDFLECLSNDDRQIREVAAVQADSARSIPERVQSERYGQKVGNAALDDVIRVDQTQEAVGECSGVRDEGCQFRVVRLSADDACAETRERDARDGM